jgi:hypothetical protein
VTQRLKTLMLLQRLERSLVSNLEFKDEDDAIEKLILAGALEVAGIDIDTGEPVYNFTEKLIDVNPELHNEVSTYFSRETMALWQEGFLDMDITEKNPIVRLTQKALDEIEVANLNKDKQYTLKEIIRIISLDR